MKFWDKGFSTDKKIDHFTVGNDRELDLHLAKYDVIASRAHAKMLGKIGLLTQKETDDLIKELYKGIRPAPGYPASPEHSEKVKLFDLL